MSCMARCQSLFAALAFSIALVAQSPEEIKPLDIDVAVEVDAAGLAESGELALTFVHKPQHDIERAFIVEARLLLGGTLLLHRDHRPPQPTRGWKKGETVRYTLPTRLPLELLLGRSGEVAVEVAFLDSETRRRVRLKKGRIGATADFTEVGGFTLPHFATFTDDVRLEAILSRADELRRDKELDQALSVLETGFRLTKSDAHKMRLRDAILSLGAFAARAPGPSEEKTIAKRIADERVRYLRQRAGRMYDRGQWHAALALLEEIGGSLQEDADEAVVGALDDVKREEKNLQELRRKIRARISDEDKAEANALSDKLGRTKKLFDKALGYRKKGQLALARHLFRSLRVADDAALRSAAYKEIGAIEEKLLSAIPEGEKKLLAAELNHPAFQRTTVLTTHRFIFIGPTKFLAGIPEPSKLRFDLSYILLTDLFGTTPNPDGDRITVYFKELFDFPGGVAGGRTIDIGRARPKLKSYRVDTELMYHELTHCIEDVRPKFHGFTEGLAEVGAAYCAEFLSKKTPSKRLFEAPLAAFKRHYLDRDVEYWRIQEYAPSCGFFLHFVHRYAKSNKNRHDWSGLRSFFRDYRDAPIRDGREPQIVRAIAHYLVKNFGPKAFDDLLAFRFPLQESDRKAIARELDHFAKGLSLSERDEIADELLEHPNSVIPRDLRYGELQRMIRDRAARSEVRRFGRRELGIIYDWNVIGPFKAQGFDPDAHVFPPEVTVDLTQRYRSESNVCKWAQPGDKEPLRINDAGWLRIDYPYQDRSAIYAASWIEVPADKSARAHLRGDDDVTLFVNGKLIGKYRGRGENGSSRLAWRGPVARAPDAMIFDIKLKAGWNRVLLKIRNRWGPAGAALALTEPNSDPIDELDSSAEPPEGPSDAKKASEWKRVLRHRFEGKGIRSKLDVAVGAFKVRRKHLEGSDRSGRVLWRPFDVRPGVTKDSPSNLAWLKDKATRNLTDFRLRMQFAADSDPPKIGVTFQGEGKEDGLSGWTLLLFGQKRLRARLERYDRLVYEGFLADYRRPDKGSLLEIRFEDGTLTVLCDERPIFDRRPLRAIEGRHRIGFMTWGPGVRIHSYELDQRR